MPGQTRQKRGSHWDVLFNPQAAIVAGLLVIAGAVLSGFGTSFAAKEARASALRDGDEVSVEFAADFPVVE
jgi:hypothetical protein